jgi:hypothetical protein
VNNDTDSEPDVVLGLAIDSKRPKIASAIKDGVVVDLEKTDAEMIIRPYVDTSAESHCKVVSTLIESKSSRWWCYKSIARDILMRNTGQDMSKRPKTAAAQLVVLELDSAHELGCLKLGMCMIKAIDEVFGMAVIGDVTLKTDITVNVDRYRTFEAVCSDPIAKAGVDAVKAGFRTKIRIAAVQFKLRPIVLRLGADRGERKH